MLATKTTVDYGKGATVGRMYGYGFSIQLYNDNESKGIKGMEYPKGEISFDIDLKLERSKFGSSELENITAECTPILWQYNDYDWSNVNGNIENREFFRAAHILIMIIICLWEYLKMQVIQHIIRETLISIK